MEKEKFTQTDRTTLKRRPHRGIYDRDFVYSVLDSAYMCTLAYRHNGSTMVLPTAYGRIDDHIYIHGSNKSTMLASCLDGQEICVNVTLIDSLVLGKSLYNHSVNYRSIAIFAKPELVTDIDEKQASYKAFCDQFMEGRYDDIRKPTTNELNSTTVMKVPLAECVAKVRSGPPTDFEKDADIDCWAGEVHVQEVVHSLEAAPGVPDDQAVPDYIKGYERLPVINAQMSSNEADDV